MLSGVIKKREKVKSKRGLESFSKKGFSIEEMVSIVVSNVKMGDIKMRLLMKWELQPFISL